MTALETGDSVREKQIGDHMDTMHTVITQIREQVRVDMTKVKDEAHAAVADLLGAASPAEVKFGNNMTSLTFAGAVSPTLRSCPRELTS